MAHTRDWIFHRTQLFASMREDLRCLLCPPNRGENSRRWVKHGADKPRYKNIDRTTIRHESQTKRSEKHTRRVPALQAA